MSSIDLKGALDNRGGNKYFKLKKSIIRIVKEEK